VIPPSLEIPREERVAGTHHDAGGGPNLRGKRERDLGAIPKQGASVAVRHSPMAEAPRLEGGQHGEEVLQGVDLASEGFPDLVQVHLEEGRGRLEKSLEQEP